MASDVVIFPQVIPDVAAFPYSIAAGWDRAFSSGALHSTETASKPRDHAVPPNPLESRPEAMKL